MINILRTGRDRPIYVFFRIKSEFSAIEMQLLANHLKQNASIKEQITGGIDFHIRAFKPKNKS